MKRKFSTKTIILSILAVLTLVIAITGTVVFLKDSGESSAREEQNQNITLPVTGNDMANTTEATNQLNTNTENQNSIENTNVGEINSTNTANGENRNSQRRNTNTAERPATTTVEQEKLVAKETSVNWYNLDIAAHAENYTEKDINYNNLRYTVEYYYDGIQDETKTDVFGEKKLGEIITSYEDKQKEGFEFLKATDKDGNPFAENPLVISSNEKNNIIKVYYESPEFEILKTFKLVKKEGNNVADKAELGDTILYTVTVYNKGNVIIRNLKLTDSKLNITIENINITVEEGQKNIIEDAPYIVTQEDINKQENILNVAVAKLGDKEKDSTTETPVVEENKDFDIIKTFKLIKKEGNTVTDKAELGDTILYTVTVYNKGNVYLRGITVIDSKLNITIENVNITVEEGQKTVIENAPYVVTQEDINKQENILNVAVAKLGDKEKDSTTETPVVEENKDFDIIKTFKLIKKEGNTVTDKAELGDTILYTVTVYNKGNVYLRGITVIDSKLNITIENVNITVEEGQKTVIENAPYVVTQDDINKQENILNVAVAKLEDKEKDSTTETPVTEAKPEVSIQKDITAITVNGVKTQFGTTNVTQAKITNGNTITYKITAKNDGKATLFNVQIKDDRTVNLEDVQLPERLKEVEITVGNTVNKNTNLLGRTDITLEPQEEITLIVSYTLKKEDVVGENYGKQFVNTAFVTGTHNNVEYNDEDDAKIDTEYIIPRTSKTFEKIWNDTNYENARPTSIKIQLYRGNQKEGEEVTINSSKNWKYTWNDLDAEDTNGNKINYLVKEVSVPEGYTASDCTVDRNGNLIITNTYNKLVDGIVEKKWTSSSTTEIPVPIDVVFIVDTSLSMIDGNSTRAANMVTAVNGAMSKILSSNKKNRVAVVGYSESGKYSGTNNTNDASVLLELGRYTTDNNQYLQLIDRNKIRTNVKQLSNQRTRYVEQGTYTQAGIELGAKQLINNSSKTTTIDNQTVKRQPIIILASDGEPSFYTDAYNNVSAGNKLGDGRLTVDIIPNGKAEYGYYTILSANYYKQQVTKSYGKEAKMFTIAMDLGTHFGKTVLNPTSGNVNSCNNHSELISTNLYNYLNDGYNDIPNPYAGNYNYANGSYSGVMSAEELENAMKGFITSTVPQSKKWKIEQSQIDSAKVELPDLKNDGEFTIAVNGKTIYNTCQEAMNNGVVVGDETSGYYVLLNKLPEASKIKITYEAK